MFPRGKLGWFLVFFTAAASCATSSLWAGDTDDLTASVARLVAATVEQEKIPGMIAGIGDARGLRAVAASGVRVWGHEAAMTVDDVVHLGSCTKALTCVMLATLVAEGKLDWSTKLVDVLPDLKEKIHPDYHEVTLWQLVTHRAGVPANAANWWLHRDLPITERRRRLLEENLTAPAGERRGAYHYSNLGYMAAGCMAEKVTGRTWEQLMRARLFEPLKMDTAGFGPPGRPKDTSQPWGHVPRSDGGWLPRWFDNAEALGPAGTVHCSVADWAKFLALWLTKEDTVILPRDALDRLLQPVGEYAGGWTVVERRWGRGRVLTHSGSNTMWYATVWVAPKTGRSYLAVMNACDDRSHAICDRVIAKMIQLDRQLAESTRKMP